MQNKQYHDSDEYIDDDFDDDFSSNNVDQSKNEIDTNNSEEVKIINKINYKTDTSSYNPMNYQIISPEEAEEENRRLKQNENITNEEYADPILGQAIKQIEDKLKRKITYDEFDKLCKTYAAELVNKDAEIKGTEPSKTDYKLYYDTLIQNKKVVPAYLMRMQNYENSMIDEIDDLMQKHSKYNENDLNIKLGDKVNIRHKGKVIIRDENKSREYIINNGNDVKLLHMKYREDWINKKFGDQINGSQNSQFHDNDGFE